MKSMKAFIVCAFTLSMSVNVYCQQSSIKIIAPKENRHLTMPWRNCIVVGRANNLLRVDMLEHLAYAQSIMGYRYCRFMSSSMMKWM